MKKRLVILGLTAALSMSVIACGKDNKEGSDKANTEQTASPAPSVDEVAVLSADLTKDVELGEYKGLEITEVDATVTDEDVETQINNTLKAKTTWDEQKKDYKAASGDQVNIDFVGKIDGKEFDGGSAEGTDLVLGSNTMIPGFEDQIIGHKTGEKFDIKVTFPDPYSGNTDLSGKEAVFTITLNKVSKPNVPKLTDKYVKETLSKTSKTVAEYKKEVRDSLQDTANENKKQTEYSRAIQAAMDNAKMKNYPEDAMTYYKNLANNYYTSMAMYSYGVDLETYYQAYGFTAETWDAQMKESAENMIKQQAVVQAIAKAEGLEVTDKEYNAKLKEYYAQYDKTSEKELTEAFGEGILYSIKDEVRYNKVCEFLLKNDKLVKATAAPTATPAAETTAEPQK